MRHKRFAFIRKNAKVVIPILIVIIFVFSFINHNQEQSSEGLSNMYTIDELKKDTDLNSVSNNLDYTIAQATDLGKGERGLFAKKNYKKDDVIEVCPTLKMNSSNVDKKNVLRSYFFTPHNKTNNDSLLALGYCGLINDSKSKQNCSWIVSDDDNNITMYATKDIARGEEFFTSYGENYWASKNKKVE
jgi:hypothetical protein